MEHISRNAAFELLKKYNLLEEKLGGEGASEKVAKLIVNSI